jgi:iron complex transport system permease protein
MATADTVASAVEAVRRARRQPVRRHRRVVCSLSVLLVGAFAARVLLGDFTITVADFVRILSGAEIPGATFILMEDKLPRAVLGVLAGAAFGLAGTIFQTTLRNPLASPDLIGVSLGASAAAVWGIVVLGLSGPALSALAVAGALLVALVVRVVAGPHRGYRLVLVGVTVAAGLSSVIQYLFTRADVYDAQLALRWLTGSLNGVPWSTIRVLALLLVLALPLLAQLARAQRAIELGPDPASGLGVPRVRTDLLLLVAVLLTAAGVAAAGPIAFVALLSGPIARALNAGRASLPAAALVGAVIVVASDYVAVYSVPDVNLPVGVVTGALGAPLLIWLLVRGRTGRSAP